MMAAALMMRWLLAAAVPSESCAELAAGFQADLERSMLAMEPQGVMSFVYARASEAQDRCADDEAVAYFRLRALELGRGALVGRQPQSTLDEWRAIARATSAHFPGSVRIATIQARASGTLGDARRAADLDPKYVPAQVALGAALILSDPTAAVGVLSSLKDLGAVSDGFTVLSRARYASGDLDGAEKAARAALKGGPFQLIEPDGRDPRPASQAHEVLGLVFLAKRRYRQAVSEFRVAERDCEQSRSILAEPPPALRPYVSPKQR